MIEALQGQAASHVAIATFRRTYFPHPGGVVEGVTFSRDGNQTPFITIRRLTIVGSYTGLLRNHISQIRAEDFCLKVSPTTTSGTSGPIVDISTTSGLSIGEIIADGAVVEITPAGSGKQALVFTAHKLALHSITDSSPLSFDAVVQIPEPPGLVHVAGKFGPWKSGQGGQTALSGSYTLQNADLGAFDGIAGILSSRGTFSGVMQHLTVDGTTDVPKFELTRNRHPVHLATSFHALVNGMNGDVALDQVVGRMRKSTVIFTGDISGQGAEEGKIATLQMYSNSATINDLMWLFIREKQPPMLGSIRFKAKVTLPPGERPFLNKLRLAGDFTIDNATFANPDTQKKLDVMSARARGEADKVEDENDKRGNDSYDPGRLVSSLKGHVEVRNAVATLTDLSFDAPGVAADGHGTYSLLNERVSMHGTVHIQAKLSQATTGVKSFLLKVVQPFSQKKKSKGSTLAATVGGTYHNPSFTFLPIPTK